MTRRALGSGAIFASAAQVTTALALGAASIVVARLLGPEGAGAYGVVASGVVLLITLGSFGLGVGITYSVSHGRWPAGAALRQAQIPALVIGAFAAGTGVALAVLFDDSVLSEVPLGTSMLAVAAVPFAISWMYSWSVALGADRYEWYALAYAGQAVLVVVLIAALAPFFGLTGAVVGLAASYAIAATVQIAIGTRRTVGDERLLADLWLRLRKAASFGLRAYASNSVTYLALRADLFILSASANPAAVGHYAIALALTELVLLLPRSLSAVVLPRVAALDATAESDYQRLVLVKSIRHSILVAVTGGLLLAAASPLVPLVYGPDFVATIALTLLLIPGAAALGVGASFSAATAGKGKPEYSLYATTLVTLPATAVYLVVIPKYGATGAAIASTGCYTTLSFVSWLFFRRATGMRDVLGLLPRPADLADYRTTLAGLRPTRRSLPPND